jgi:hypothetical protein
MKRTVTRTATVTISARETRLRALLESIAAANDHDEQPTKAVLVGNAPSQTRANQYRQIDELISRHLATSGLDGKGYHLEITPAGREVLAHGIAEATWEADEYGDIRWAITEYICDGASFTWSFDGRDQATDFAAQAPPDPDGSVVARVLTELWWRSGDSVSTAEVLSSDTIWSRAQDR